MKLLNKDMIVTEALEVDPEVAEILMSEGLHCLNCGAASGETLAEAGIVHGFAPDDMERLCNAINVYLKQKHADDAQA